MAWTGSINDVYASPPAPRPAPTPGVPQLSGPDSNPPPAGGPGGDMKGFIQYLNNGTNQNLAAGKAFADTQFGANNPQIKQIEDLERQRMTGMNTDEVNAMRDQGTAQINSQLGTGLSALRGINSANHVVGGAAAGTAMPLLNNANQLQSQLANNINLANIQRQNTALGQYQSTVTGERAGGLNTMFGFAGLGQANQNAGLQYGLGQDYLDYVNRNLGNNPGPGTGGGGGGSGPLGSTGSDIGATLNNKVTNGSWLGRYGNLAGFGSGLGGYFGGFNTILQGGNPVANTPLSPSTWGPSNW